MEFAYSRVSRALVAFAIAFIIAVPAVAAPTETPIGSIVGTVVDASNGAPLPNVAVRVVGTKLETRTDAAGHFMLTAVPVGRFVLSLNRNDYQPAISEPIRLVRSRSRRRCRCTAAPATSARLP